MVAAAECRGRSLALQIRADAATRPTPTLCAPARGVEKHVIIVDFKGYSIMNAPPLRVAKQSLSLVRAPCRQYSPLSTAPALY